MALSLSEAADRRWIRPQSNQESCKADPCFTASLLWSSCFFDPRPISCHLRQPCKACAVQRSPAHMVRGLHESLRRRSFESKRESCTSAPASILSAKKRPLAACRANSEHLAVVLRPHRRLGKAPRGADLRMIHKPQGKKLPVPVSPRAELASASAKSTAVSSPGAPRA